MSQIRIDLSPELHQLFLLMLSQALGKKMPDIQHIESMTLELEVAQLPVAAMPPESLMNEDQQYYVQHGATLVMMMDYFSISRREAAKLLRRYSYELSTGRCPMPDTKTRDEIHRIWAELTNYPNEMVHLRALHRQFPDLSLRTLHAVVREFDR